jgi:hypothetical protein
MDKVSHKIMLLQLGSAIYVHEHKRTPLTLANMFSFPYYEHTLIHKC